MDKRIVLGLIGIGLAATFGTEAIAATCALRSSSGTCLFWTGSVEGDLVTDAQGNTKKAPVINLEAIPNILGKTSGVIACGAPGNDNTSPGIQTQFVPNIFAITPTPTAFELRLFKFTTILASDVDKKGVARLTLFGEPDPVGSRVPDLHVFCPNPNWRVVDFAPCDATMNVVLNNSDGSNIDQAHFVCTLDSPPGSCATLHFDQTAGNFERRQYQCGL